MKPNLFDYATSELSQDAFLCWLLKWGESSFHSVDEELNRIAIEFIDEIFSLHGYKRDYEIKQVHIIRQFKGLDVLAIIDEKYAILIEDKTFTSEHSGQLERYLEEVKTNISTRDLIPLPTYYKIIEQSNHQAIHKAGYQPFTRDRMIKILESHRRNLPMNTIIDDYLHHLKRLDDDINSYQTLPIAKWTAFSWQGFYRDLQKRLDGKWGYVSNPSGGFWGFWWKGNEQQYHYWQLEETVLRAKIEAKENPDVKAYRDMCMSTLMKDSSECDLKLKRPKRISTGKNMTIAYRENYLQLQENGLLDFEKTVFELERYGQYKQSVKSEDI